MTTIKLEYYTKNKQLHEPAIEFFGSRADAFKELWDKTRQDTIKDNIAEYNKLSKDFLDTDARGDKLRLEYLSLKKWFRPWRNKRQREIVKEQELLFERLTILSDAMQSIRRKLVVANDVLLNEAHKMLKDNGFVMINYTKDGNGIDQKGYEIWATTD